VTTDESRDPDRDTDRDTDRVALLAAYDTQLRGSAENDGGAVEDTDGPLIRLQFGQGGYVSYRSLDGLDGPALDALIARQVAHFGALGQQFEWKTRGHDLPADLPERLLAAGFVAEDTETIVIGRTDQLAATVALPDGVTLRAVHEPADLQRIEELESMVWNSDRSWIAQNLSERLTHAREQTVILVAEADGVVVSAAWLVVVPGTEFAGLWGGATLPAWQGRGIYRALVARRAQFALERGVRYLQVDASDDSRPILERLGFVAITTTTPYIWSP
jgi:GNAT superfamily N-acetyltransferase